MNNFTQSINTDIILTNVFVSGLIIFIILFLLFLLAGIIYNKLNKIKKSRTREKFIIEKKCKDHNFKSLKKSEIKILFDTFLNIEDLSNNDFMTILESQDKNEIYDLLKNHVINFNSLPQPKKFILQKFKEFKNKYKPYFNDEIIEVKKRKLEAELSIGVLAALTMGFSISIFDLKNETFYDFLIIDILKYIHVIIGSLVSSLSMINVISSTSIYFKGMKKLSSNRSKNDIILEFNSWWNDIRKFRKSARYCFIYNLPLFLLSFVTNPDIWTNNLYLAIISTIIIIISIVFGIVLYYRINK